ncbi:MAG: hypothetical protein RSF67_09655, partial [Clostridia bacterium]
MSIIKLKRGARASLTTLNTGEAAFTIDTKELFIGDGSNNINLTPFNKNYLVNSNFQYPLITSDIINYSSIFLQAYAKKYIYGNYFVSNSTPSNGTISIDLSTNSNGMCRFTCNNAVPKIDYRLKLPRYKSGSNTYDYSSPLENKVLTLSFDVKNLN